MKENMFTEKQWEALDKITEAAAWLNGAEDAAREMATEQGANGAIIHACKEGARRLNEILEQMEN